MIISVYDKDKKYLTDDKSEFMGYSLVNLDHSNLVKDKDELFFPSPPKWFKIHFHKSENAGKLLMSF